MHAYLTTVHTEDHTTRTGRKTTRRVTTQWHMPVTETEARERIATDHNGRNVTVVAPVTHSHAWRGLTVACADLTHCPSVCTCPLGECDATTV